MVKVGENFTRASDSPIKIGSEHIHQRDPPKGNYFIRALADQGEGAIHLDNVIPSNLPNLLRRNRSLRNNFENQIDPPRSTKT